MRVMFEFEDKAERKRFVMYLHAIRAGIYVCASVMLANVLLLCFSVISLHRRYLYQQLQPKMIFNADVRDGISRIIVDIAGVFLLTMLDAIINLFQN